MRLVPGRPPRPRGAGCSASALRRDPQGDVARLLERCIWVPDLEAALSLRTRPAARLARRHGGGRGGHRRGPGAGRPARVGARAAQRLPTELERTAAQLEAPCPNWMRTLSHVDAARRTGSREVQNAREELDAARRARRVAEERERAVARAPRRLPARPPGRRTARACPRSRRSGARRRSRARGAGRASGRATAAEHAAGQTAAGEALTARPTSGAARTEIAALEGRLRALQTVRDARAAEVKSAHARRSEAEEQRRRAEIGLGLDTGRLDELDRRWRAWSEPTRISP